MERTGNNTYMAAGRRTASEVNYVRSSVVPGSDRNRVPAGAVRQIAFGDRIFVRMVSVERGWRTIAEFELRNVADMSDVYGELRHYTSGQRGLTRLYVRNATRGWSFEQPFMLYGDTHRVPAASVTRAPRQPEQHRHSAQPSLWQSQPGDVRQIPESVRMLYGDF